MKTLWCEACQQGCTALCETPARCQAAWEAKVAAEAARREEALQEEVAALRAQLAARQTPPPPAPREERPRVSMGAEPWPQGYTQAQVNLDRGWGLTEGGRIERTGYCD